MRNEAVELDHDLGAPHEEVDPGEHPAVDVTVRDGKLAIAGRVFEDRDYTGGPGTAPSGAGSAPAAACGPS